MKKKKLITGILFSLLLAFSFTGCKEKESETLNDFKPPVSFKWEGNYVDEEGTTTLTIEKKGGKSYACTVNVVDEEITHIDTYEFTATEDDYGLSYEDGVHTSFEIPDYEKDPEASTVATETYTDGTGSIYYLEDRLYWSDDKNDAGNGFVFQKVEESEE